MSDAAKHKRDSRIRRHQRIRRKVAGTAVRPRLAVYRSNKHIEAQLVDDVDGRTLAEQAKAAGVTAVVFDRGGFLFHGRVKALADAAREGGLEF